MSGVWALGALEPARLHQASGSAVAEANLAPDRARHVDPKRAAEQNLRPPMEASQRATTVLSTKAARPLRILFSILSDGCGSSPGFQQPPLYEGFGTVEGVS